MVTIYRLYTSGDAIIYLYMLHSLHAVGSSRGSSAPLCALNPWVPVPAVTLVMAVLTIPDVTISKRCYNLLSFKVYVK